MKYEVVTIVPCEYVAVVDAESEDEAMDIVANNPELEEFLGPTDDIISVTAKPI